MSEKRSGAENVSVFAMPRTELRQLILDHAKNARANAAKVRAAIPKEDEKADSQWGTAISKRREMLEAAAKGIDRRADEALYLAEHLAPEEVFRMTASELLAFQGQFQCIDINVDRLVLTLEATPDADKQAERSLGATLIQVPRQVLPPGIITR